MIFDSLGMGELGVIFVLIILLVDPKKVGKIMQSLGKFKRKMTHIQSEVKSQFHAIALAEDMRESHEKRHADKAGMRRWAREQVQNLPGSTKEAASEAILKSLVEWEGYQNAKVISCFAGTLDEVDTSGIFRRILADGKTLLVPYIVNPSLTSESLSLSAAPEEGVPSSKSAKTLAMATITDPEQDLTEGAFGIQEPRDGLKQGQTPPAPDLVLVPGLCFDSLGGRIGKGLGFYDRYLASPEGSQAFKVGIAFDVQITQKKLTLEAHDQRMDIVLSEKRFLVLSAHLGFQGKLHPNTLPPSPVPRAG